MNTAQIKKTLTEIPAGRFFRVRYISKCKMTAKALKDGIVIFKVVDTTTRTGVQYENIEGVELKNNSEGEIQESSWEWVVKNRIKKNLNTGKEYVVIAPLKKGANSVVHYIMITKDGSISIINEAAAKEHTVASYWVTDRVPAVVNVTMDNVLLVR